MRDLKNAAGWELENATENQSIVNFHARRYDRSPWTVNFMRNRNYRQIPSEHTVNFPCDTKISIERKKPQAHANDNGQILNTIRTGENSPGFHRQGHSSFRHSHDSFVFSPRTVILVCCGIRSAFPLWPHGLCSGCHTQGTSGFQLKNCDEYGLRPNTAH